MHGNVPPAFIDEQRSDRVTDLNEFADEVKSQPQKHPHQHDKSERMMQQGLELVGDSTPVMGARPDSSFVGFHKPSPSGLSFDFGMMKDFGGGLVSSGQRVCKGCKICG
jgi:hypothetical protein